MLYIVMKCLYPGEVFLSIEKTKKAAISKCKSVDHFWMDVEIGKSIQKQINSKLTNEYFPLRMKLNKPGDFNAS